MLMTMRSRSLQFLLHTLLWLLLSVNTCYAVQTDIDCLQELKNQLKDPNNRLSSWTFTNLTEGFMCKFIGIECWHPDESRVLSIRLSNMGLRGQFPTALENCTSMTGLDLSSNNLSGPIPPNINEIIKYVVKLDLSFNKFSGTIPPLISNVTFLNVLNLNNNQLTGQIPWQLTQLSRLSTFSVADNSLSGKIPFTNRSFPAASYANNKGLCGKPLADCKRPPKKSHNSTIVGLAVAAVLLVLATTIVLYYCISRGSRCKKKDVVEREGGLTVKSPKQINGIKLKSTTRRSCNVKISTFAQTVPKMRLIDLLKATDSFSNKNIIGSGRRGTMYKGELPDGSLVAVKRLQDYHKNFHKHFISEMTTLGSTQHRNLVPLLGFCVARRERLLIYKYMQNGTLYQHLHQVGGKGKIMEWPQRLRISIGVARGLAWLHHKCNPAIVHGNITSKAVLFDEYYEAKVSDFRCAKLVNNFISYVFGDVGYVAPEFEHVLDTLTKGDVYRFGVVMLELVTGREPTQVINTAGNFDGNLVQWITHLSNYSRLQDAICESLIGKGYDEETMEFLKVACACVEFDPDNRPTMLEVYEILRATGQRAQVSAEHRMFMPAPHCVSIACQDEIVLEKE